MGKENKLAMIKICGIKDMNTAHIAIDAGVNALGFVFAESSRRILPEDAKKNYSKLTQKYIASGSFCQCPSIFSKRNCRILQSNGSSISRNREC